jgi:hypothetical protein
MNVKGAKPGRYTPKCSRCGRAFAVTVPGDPKQTLVVAALPEGPKPAATAAKKAPPRKPAAPPAARDQTAPLPPPAVDPESTGPPVPAGALETTAPGTAPPAAPPVPAKGKQSAVPETLGGYRVLKELGRGGMGAVFLARQLSLDRNVALKVMNPEWAKDPTFLARFTREAYAAAQLVHHNVVQIYDIGTDREVNYFSMEFVDGQSLADLVKRQGKLDVEAAVGYALQAARGLKFAHDQGMIHRDVKPDNLMLNKQGIVKVADLGLVKTPEAVAEEEAAAGSPRPPSLAAVASANVTRAHTAMGTPAYMAPEQARDAAHVDARADVYALGCTLYVLVTGRPVFPGKTVLEVLSKHAQEPVVPPDVIVKRVPKALSDIIVKMVAKRPDDRYPDLGAVIGALEDFLGVQSAGTFSPREEHAATLEEAVQRFNSAPAARLRSWLVLGFFGGCAVLLLLSCLVRWWLAAGFAGLAVLTPLCYLLVSGYREKTYLFAKVRELVLGSRLIDGLVVLAAGLLFLGALLLLHLFLVAIVFFVLAVGLAVGFHFWIDRQLAAQRQEPVARVEQMLRGMRLQGLDEDELRHFVCKYSGEQWEAFYEALFGYEAKLAARARWGQGTRGRLRDKSGAWREPVISWIEARQRARREARERKHLQAIEQKNLQARGVSAAEAEARAEQAAEAMVHKAAQIKAKAAKRAAAPAEAPAPAEAEDLANVATLLQLPDRPEMLPAGKRRRSAAGRLLGGTFGLVFGAQMRFLVGAVLLAGCAGWAYQNGLIPGQEIQKLAGEALEHQDVPDTSGVHIDLARQTQPLSLPLVPAVVTNLFDGFNSGAAALILLLSIFFRGWRIALFAWPAALVAFAGHRLGIPALGPLSAPVVSMIAGAVLAVPGLVPAARTAR